MQRYTNVAETKLKVGTFLKCLYSSVYTVVFRACTQKGIFIS